MSAVASAAALSPEQLAAFDLGEGPVAVLCLHGFTGTPYEMRPLGEALAVAGFRARGPLLPGHAGTVDELGRVLYTDWLGAARSVFDALAAEHEHVCVVGLSMGALLTLAVCSERPVAAAAVIGAPLSLRFPIPLLVPILKPFLRSVPKKDGSDIRDPLARARHPSMSRMPLAGIHELVRLQRYVRARLDRVEAPLLVAYGRHDQTADPREAQRICRAVSSRSCDVLMLEDSGHVVTVDHDGPRLAAALVGFLSDSRRAQGRC